MKTNNRSKKPKKSFRIDLESHYAGQVRIPIYASFATKEKCIEFCKMHYNFYKTVKIDGEIIDLEKIPFIKRK